MGVFEMIAVLTTLAAGLAFINVRLLRLPTTIGLMALSLAAALGVLGLGLVLPAVHRWAEQFIGQIDFSETLLEGMLGYLLFAGALHVDLSALKAQRLAVGLLASLGVAVSTALVGGAAYALLPWIGLEIPLIYCLIFGAIVAPTDPIAVLSIMKKVGAPEGLETKITGESLFNDGVGVVLFLGLLGFAGLSAHGGEPTRDSQVHAVSQGVDNGQRFPGLRVKRGQGPQRLGGEVQNPVMQESRLLGPLATGPVLTPVLIPRQMAQRVPRQSGGRMAEAEGGGRRSGGRMAGAGESASAHGDQPKEETSFQTLGLLFVKEALGGAVFGFVIGLIAYWMLRGIDDYKTEILISLALVTGGYALASHLEFSGPIAMVIAGLLIGNPGRALAMSRTTREHLDTFWELVDEVLNAVLFVLIGLEVLIVSATGWYVLAGVGAIGLSLGVRTIIVGSLVWLLGWARAVERHTTLVMVWGGLRGGISVALALGLRQAVEAQQAGPQALVASELIVTMTYVVVIFSILVQGLTISPLLRRLGLSQG